MKDMPKPDNRRKYDAALALVKNLVQMLNG